MTATRLQTRALRGLVVLTAVGLAACSDSGPDIRPTEILVLPTEVSFDALGDTRRLTPTVRDQNGIAMDGVQVSWSSADPSVASVDAVGVVTSVGNGSTTVVASAGSASGSVPVTVAQTVSTIDAVQGADQSGTVGDPLPTPLVVGLLDRLEQPVRGVTVTFSPTIGSGSVNPQQVTTDAQGRASTTWTLGEDAGDGQTVRAGIEGSGLVPLAFRATALAGPPAILEAISGQNQTGTTGQTLAVPFGFRLSDRFGNPLRNEVTFSVVSGGGSLDRSSAVPEASGETSVLWTLGSTVGTQQIRASAGSASATASATAVSGVGSPASLTVTSGAEFEAPALSGDNYSTVVVRDAAGAGVPGVTVTFTPSDGYVRYATVVSDASGAATNAWTLGATVGTQTLTISVEGLAPVTVTANALDPEPSCVPQEIDSDGYDIQLCYVVPVSATVREAFESARERWEAIIVGDLSDIPTEIEAGECGETSLPINGMLDDLIIFVTIEEIDGPFGTLGSAGPCYIRLSNTLTTVGRMRFDVADLDRLSDQGRLGDVILHEMGHVVGIGTLWSSLGFLQNPSNGQAPYPDTHFTGPLAIAAFDAAGGSGRVAGQKVPVENAQGGSGTLNSHWRESVMATELMTGFLNGGVPNPLSNITVQSLADLGYTVDNTTADTYTVASPDASLRAGPGELIELGDDIWWGPLRVVNDRGRVVTIVSPPALAGGH